VSINWAGHPKERHQRPQAKSKMLPTAVVTTPAIYSLRGCLSAHKQALDMCLTIGDII